MTIVMSKHPAQRMTMKQMRDWPIYGNSTKEHLREDEESTERLQVLVARDSPQTDCTWAIGATDDRIQPTGTQSQDCKEVSRRRAWEIPWTLGLQVDQYRWNWFGSTTFSIYSHCNRVVIWEIQLCCYCAPKLNGCSPSIEA